MSNPFLDLAERQISSPVKARERASMNRAAKRAQALLKAADERALLLEMRQLKHRERVDEMLTGPYGAELRALVEFLDSMTLASIDTDEPVEFVRRGPWRDADSETRTEILILVDLKIVALREQAGLDPIDDPIPFTDTPDSTFIKIRNLLRSG